MSQGLRDMLANRRFAIPLIGLLALCFIGILMIGIVIIFQPGKTSEPVAEVTETATVAPTDTSAPTWTPSPTNSPTPRPSPTLVPVGTVPTGEAAQPTGEATSTSGGTPAVEASATTEPATGGEATVTTTTAPGGGSSAQETATPESGDDELAQTGVGWGLILFSGVGLAMLAVVARRLRMAS
jgi:cytoskeletal protein RodZ